MITLYIPYQTIVNGLSIMIIVSKQITEKDRLREIPTADDDHSENICISVCVCVWTIISFFFLSTPRVLMALGKECAREDYMNGSISITASIRQKKKYVVTTDMINCSSPSVSPFLLIHMSPFVLVFPYLKWIRIDFLSLSRSCFYLPK
jgi:hypothetical protein